MIKEALLVGWDGIGIGVDGYHGSQVLRCLITQRGQIHTKEHVQRVQNVHFLNGNGYWLVLAKI